MRWTCKSTRRLAEELQGQGHSVGYRTVAVLLRRLNYSLQSNRKTREGASHPDRNAQFEYINAQVYRFQRRGQPVVSVDLIGNTRTEAGLKIQAELDKSSYGIGIKVSDEELAAVRMKKDDFHGEWNYTILPKKGRQ